MEKKIDILYAEDNEWTAGMVKEYLEEHEFHVRVAKNGDIAWDVFRHNAPDLLLLDLEMPGINGFQLVKLVRAVNERVPVIFYSSYMNVAIELEAIKCGADDCIYKDCTLEFLMEKLRCIYHRITRDEGNPHLYFLSASTKYNAASGQLMINGQTILLKTMSARLLQLLCVKMHETAGNDYLIRGLWGNFGMKEKGNALRKEIVQLRKVLEADVSLYLCNKFGEGYVLSSSEFML